MNPSKTVIIYSASNWVSPSASMYNEMHLGVTTTGGDATTTGRTCPRIAPCRHNDAAHRALGNGRRVEGMRGAARRVSQVLRAQGLHYDRRKHLLRCEGRREIELPFTYLGADDQAGPNYTGQPAVASHYEIR